MKKSKKIKKLVKLIYEELQTLEREKYKNAEIELKSEAEVNINYANFDEVVSAKFKHFILNLIRLKDKIRVEIRKHCIYINGNLDGIDYRNTNITNNINRNEDLIDVRITKEGFSMSRNYAQTISYSDPDIYDSLFESIQEKSKEINKDILLDMIDDVMVKTNLSRESNLDQILS